MSLSLEAIENALLNLCEVGEKSEKPIEVCTALGELRINGVYYQIQMLITPVKKHWMDDDEVRTQESTIIEGGEP